MQLPIYELPVYLDHAATTPVRPEVLEAMLPYFAERFGNASAIHQAGCAAREAVDAARETLAHLLNAAPDEIVFTSGGTESDNAAIFGVALANVERGRHLLTTPIEHHAVLEPFETLAHRGWEVEYLPVDGCGRVELDAVCRLLREDTVLVSMMHANNEIGTVQPVAEVAALCRAAGVLFHTDAVQSFGRLPIDVRAMRIDLLSLTAHKFYGPKGIGALYVRRGVGLRRFQEGGEQERGRRAGTLNVPGIVGLAKAAELVCAEREGEGARQRALCDGFRAHLQERVPGITWIGHPSERLPNNLHLCIEGVEGESLLLALDAAGICASAGSACSAGSTEPSHVLRAIGIERSRARGALRLTMGRSTTREALDYTAQVLENAVRDLRSLGNPLFIST